MISHRVCTRESHVSNDNNVAPIVDPKPQNEPQSGTQAQAQAQTQAQGGFEYVTACYEYKAQKVRIISCLKKLIF